MTFQPASLTDLQTCFRTCRQSQTKIGQLDLRHFSRVIEYTPEDMTVTVGGGGLLSELQSHLARSGQWLPVDPPHPETLTIADLLAFNRSGSRRYGYGPPRDYALGMKILLGSGEIISNGGKVVKNVAGYDLMKLFIGGQNSLGMVLETTFKVLPKPERELYYVRSFNDVQHLPTCVDSLLQSNLQPTMIDLAQLSPNQESLELVIGFAGSAEEVDFQGREVLKLNFTPLPQLRYLDQFWAPPEARPFLRSISCLPSTLVEEIHLFRAFPFLAHLGHGVIHYDRVADDEPIRQRFTPGKTSRRLEELRRNLKKTFDPDGILPELSIDA